MNMLKVIQISDFHVSADGNARYRGINPRETLESMMPRITAWQPDLVLATGDLAEDGSEEAYHYLAATLGQVQAPVYTVPGNHDHCSRQTACFADTAVEEPLLIEDTRWRIVLLNSAASGQIAGVLSPPMLGGLESILADTSKPTILVLHHQPVMVGSPWIDRYPFLNTEEFWSRVTGRTSVRAVLWGHIHHDYSATKAGVNLLGCPSMAANSLAGQEKFTFAAAGPACRWLRLSDDARLETGILDLRN